MYYGMKLPNTHEHRTIHIPNFLLFLLGSWRGEALGVGGGAEGRVKRVCFEGNGRVERKRCLPITIR